MSTTSAARRVIGGILLASGSASALFVALALGWFASDALPRLFSVDETDARSPVIGVMLFGLLAAGVCVFLAGIGRLILGPRLQP